MRGTNRGNVWLKVGYSQSVDGKWAGLGRETDGGVQGPFWLSGVVVSERVLQFPPHRGGLILISNFRRVLSAVLRFSGQSPGVWALPLRLWLLECALKLRCAVINYLQPV